MHGQLPFKIFFKALRVLFIFNILNENNKYILDVIWSVKTIEIKKNCILLSKSKLWT